MTFLALSVRLIGYFVAHLLLKAMEKRYKLLQLNTEGWELFDNKAYDITKGECDGWLRQALDNGVAPERLKVAFLDDTRYPGKPKETPSADLPNHDL